MFQEFGSANLLSFVDIVLPNEVEVIEPYVCAQSLMLSHRLESDSVCYSYMWLINLSYNTSLFVGLVRCFMLLA